LGLALEIYCDAKSIGAYIVILAGGGVSWRAKEQATVASSSTEAEYMALLQATKESIWYKDS